MENWHDMIGHPYPSSTEAGRQAVNIAETHVANSMVIVLALGGPLAPWSTEPAKRLRKLGIPTLATGLCVVSDYNDVYTDVYELVTACQIVPWLHGREEHFTRNPRLA